MIPKILYEDNHLLIVEKPVNMPVQEDSSEDRDLLSALKEFIKERDNKPGNVYMGLVHRLDRPVGGAIVFAKTSKAASRLANELQRGTFDRSYLAVVHGKMKNYADTLEDYLYKDRNKNQSYVVDKKHKDSKKARLHYKTIAQSEGFTLLSIQLDTGRSHQIRVQLSNIGHPIYGDQKYGADVNKPGQQIALWSHRISVKHPTRDEIIKVSNSPEARDPWYLFSTSDIENAE